MTYDDWRLCDICGHEGMCRPATVEEYRTYKAEDVCQRCDGEEVLASYVKELETLLKTIRDSGTWFHSALEFDHNVDGEVILEQVEILVGKKK